MSGTLSSAQRLNACGFMAHASIPLSLHAEVRQQQRGIRREVLECLVAYGRREHDHAQCEVVYFDAKAISRAHKEGDSRVAHLVSNHRDVYAVINSDGRVVTTGHRSRRILRDKSQSNLRPSRHRRTRSTSQPRQGWQPVMMAFN